MSNIMQSQNSNGVSGFFNIEVRKHPSFLLFDRNPTNFLYPSEEYARGLLGEWDNDIDILDIGCGDAVDSITLAASSNRVCAIDIAENRIALARNNIMQSGLSDRISAQYMDAHVLDFPDASFDLIVGNSVLLFMDRIRFAHECYRVLKPGGRALFPNESMAGHPLLKMRRALPGVRDRETVTKRMTLDDIEEMGNIFDGIRHREFYLSSVLIAPLVSRFGGNRAVAGMFRLTCRLDEAALHQIGRLKNFCWISVIELNKGTAG